MARVDLDHVGVLGQGQVDEGQPRGAGGHLGEDGADVAAAGLAVGRRVDRGRSREVGLEKERDCG